MKLRLQTDYALRALILLGHSKRRMTANEIAEAFVISKDHLVKVIQQLSRLGYVRAIPGRGGGVVLAKEASRILVRDVVKDMEGTAGVVECFQDSGFCPMEPGCLLRRLLMNAETAFYEALGSKSISDMFAGRRNGGLVNLEVHKQEMQK